jgi:Dolichyl-phosphate-mannose-protein mannosyltransferase
VTPLPQSRILGVDRPVELDRPAEADPLVNVGLLPVPDPAKRSRPMPGRDGGRAVRLQRPSVARQFARAARSWVAQNAVGLATVVGLLVIVGVVLGIGITRYPGFADDEGTYVAQAWALGHGALSHYTYWYDHPPLGWIQLALLRSVLSPFVDGYGSVAAARITMLVPALASAGLLYALARRLGIRRGFAAAAVLLFALSPLAVSVVRQAYLDNFATPWLLAAFVFAASPRSYLWDYASAGLCFALAILSKETSLLALPGLVLAVRQGADRRTRAFCLTAFAVLLILTVAGYPLYAVLKGELLPGKGHVSLAYAIQFQLSARASTGSVFAHGSLSHLLVNTWLALDPWLVGLGVACTAPALFIRRLRPHAVTLAVFAAMPLRGGYLPQPYVIALLPFCALLIAGVADALWGRGPHASGRWIVVRRASVVVAALVFAFLTGPAWCRGDSTAMRSNQTSAQQAAERWVVSHVHRRARVLIDDTFYVDLMRAGFAPQYGAVWFEKLDWPRNVDPAVVRALPRGWREFDYVISTSVIRSALEENPGSFQQVRLALQHSRLVASFGLGGGTIEVRRVVSTDTGTTSSAPGTHHRRAKRNAR